MVQTNGYLGCGGVALLEQPASVGSNFEAACNLKAGAQQKVLHG